MPKDKKGAASIALHTQRRYGKRKRKLDPIDDNAITQSQWLKAVKGRTVPIWRLKCCVNVWETWEHRLTLTLSATHTNMQDCINFVRFHALCKREIQSWSFRLRKFEKVGQTGYYESQFKSNLECHLWTLPSAKKPSSFTYKNAKMSGKINPLN